MAQGTIARVMDKGFGFISQEEGDDLFFHMNEFDGVFDDLQPGQKVSFEIGEGPKGPNATGVSLVNDDASADTEETASE